MADVTDGVERETDVRYTSDMTQSIPPAVPPPADLAEVFAVTIRCADRGPYDLVGNPRPHGKPEGTPELDLGDGTVIPLRRGYEFGHAAHELAERGLAICSQGRFLSALAVAYYVRPIATCPPPAIDAAPPARR